MEVHIHTRTHPADEVEYHIVEEEWQKGFVEEEHRRDSVECHILNMDLLHLAVVPVLHKGFVEHYYLDQVLPQALDCGRVAEQPCSPLPGCSWP